MFRLLFVSLLVFSVLDAKITIQDIDSKPSGHAKNFMIWQYLKQNITPKQADKAYKQVDGNSNKILYVYAKKTKNKDIKRKVSCMRKKNILNIRDKECLELAFRPYKTLYLSKKQREKISTNLISKEKKELLKIQSEKPSEKTFKKYDADTILALYNGSGYKYRRKNLNLDLDKKFINGLSKSRRISYFIKTAVNDKNLDKLQKSLLKLRGDQLNSQSNFFLALNHLRYSDNQGALMHFSLSKSKAKRKIDIDKNNFWIYQVTKNKKYLDKLCDSKDINIYSLYANEILGKKVNNFFTAVDTNNEKSKKNLTSPFDWNDILKEIQSTSKEDLPKLCESYKQKDMVAVQSYILQKSYEYKKHGFIMPYDKYLNGLSTDDKALVYAIMRQESLLIPSALSRSFALGLMQIMPFVTDAISKNIKNPIKSYKEMFIPKNNLKYATSHIKWMQKSLYHPLFMSYAYNGGMGFLRKYLKKGTFTNGEYEPFLSMEMMSNSESREYGKRVLANYVIYKKIMGEDISIIYLFDTLTDPKKTDRFRARG